MDKEINSLYTAISELENTLANCPEVLFCFLLGYKKLCNQCLEKIYLSLPAELKEKKDYLISEKKDNVFSYMYKIQDIVNSHTFLNNFVLLRKSEIESLIDRIYAVLPEDIRFLGGNIQNEKNYEIEIPDFLRKDKN